MKIESTEKDVIPVLDTEFICVNTYFKRLCTENSVAAPIGLGNVVSRDSTTTYNTATLSTDITFKKIDYRVKPDNDKTQGVESYLY